MAGKNELRELIAKEFINALSEDQMPWSAMWVSDRPYNAVKGTKYNGVNALWLSFVASEKGYVDPRWCTFKQATEKGWHVMKGEHGTKIEFWSMYDAKTRKTISFREAEKIVAADPERKDDMRPTAKAYTVFNAEQIEGIPELKKESLVADISSVREKRDVLIKNMGIGFSEGGTSAFYRPSDDSITMPPDTTFKSEYGYMATFLHECGHATGHESRLNRDLSGGFGSENYAKEELRAEIASAFTAQSLGLNGNTDSHDALMDNHKAYIQSWIKAIREKPAELFAAIKDAEKISDYLIEKGEFELSERAEGVEEKGSLDDKIKEASSTVSLESPVNVKETDISL